MRRHPSAKACARLADRFQRHGVGELQQPQLRRRLDHPAAANNRISRRDLAARRPLQSVDDIKAGRRFNPDGACDFEIGRRLSQPLEGAFMLVPGPHIRGNHQGFANRRLLEGGRDDDGAALRGDQRRRGPLRAPPSDACEVVEAGARLHQQRAQPRLAHQLLRLGDPDLALLARDRRGGANLGCEIGHGISEGCGCGGSGERGQHQLTSVGLWGEHDGKSSVSRRPNGRPRHLADKGGVRPSPKGLKPEAPQGNTSQSAQGLPD